MSNQNKNTPMIGVTSEKQFGFYEILGLKKALYAIELSNPKRSVKVDYWLSKNEKIVGEAFAKYLQEETSLISEYAETFQHEELKDKKGNCVKFIVYKGKDDSDTLLNDSGMYFKVTYEGEKPLLEIVMSPTWDLIVPPAEEGGEPTVKPMRYSIKFKSEDEKQAFDQKLSELQNGFSTSCDLWTLKESELEGLNVIWKGRDEDLTQFRDVLYDNAIKAE